MKRTVIYHSNDYDGIFSREIARRFVGRDAELIGWHFTDKPLEFPREGTVYVIDLPVDRVFGADFSKREVLTAQDRMDLSRVIWIDHHKTAIDSHPKDIPGYRIDGVAACRLAWQYFSRLSPAYKDLPMPTDIQFKNREVIEPLAVRLAGEYDVWDHRDNDADIAFQFGLDAQDQLQWDYLLGFDGAESYKPSNYCSNLINDGRAAMRCYAKRDADVMRERSFLAEFEGLKFLCLNTARCNSNTFNERDVPETGHDALFAFFWDGQRWSVSLYHARHRKDLDLSEIARRHGGGGHRGACGFTTEIIIPEMLKRIP